MVGTLMLLQKKDREEKPLEIFSMLRLEKNGKE